MKTKIPINITIILLITIKLTLALNLGSLVKNNQAILNPGESVEFTILLWQTSDSPIIINFKEKHLPEDWFVIFKPNKILLQPEKPTQNPIENTEYVSTSSGFIKTTPIKVIIKTSETTKKGIYELSVSALAGEQKNSPISITQERDFSFKINITKDGVNVVTETEISNNETTETTQFPEDIKDEATANVTEVDIFKTPTIIFVFLIVVVVLILIKKIKYKS